MKRFLTVLFATLLLTAALCVSASASSFDETAEELSAIGIFRGTGSGFQLDQAPTRAQAAIMLVRLYGAEEEAQAAFTAGTLTSPFTDVGETAAPYVAWLKDKGIANGTSATTFGAANPCSAQMYTAFLLRALGYQDGTDFAYADAQAFAAGLGLLDTSVSGKFLRDDLAALTYQALAVDLKDGSTYLLDSLIQSGAVKADAAKPITDKIEAYRAFLAAGKSVGTALDVDVDAKMTIALDVSGAAIGSEGGTGTTSSASQSTSAAVKGNIQMNMEKDLEMACDMTVSMAEETQQMNMWLKDGNLYMRSGEEAYQYPLGLDQSEIQALLAEQGSTTSPALLPFLKSITAKTESGSTVYTLTLNNALANLIGGVFDAVSTELPAWGMNADFSMKDASITYTFDSNGQLKNTSLTAKLEANVAMDTGESGKVDLHFALDMDMKMDVNASGADVTITFPDFSGFQVINGGATAAAVTTPASV